MAKVAFGVTAYGPIWAPAVSSWLSAIAHASRTMTVEHIGKIRSVGVTDRMYTHQAENYLVEQFLALEDATHLFMTEMDMILPNDAITKLLELDQPVASGIYFLRDGDGAPCLYKKTVTTKDNPYPMSPVSVFPEHEPFLIDCPGLGCVLIRRDVLETVPQPWFDLSAKKFGSDMYFYTHVKQAGFEVWAHPGVMCGQIDYRVWQVSDYHERVKHDPNFAPNGFIIGNRA